MALSNSLNSLIRIDKTLVDYSGMRVKRNGQWYKIESKQLTLLQLLVSRQGETITRDELLDKIWPSVIVSDNSLSKLVTELRKNLGDDRAEQHYIRTVPRVGYQLIAPVTEVKSHALPTTSRSAAFIALGCTLLGMLISTGIGYFGQNIELEDATSSSLLTHQPGIEQGVSFSHDGQYMVYHFIPRGQSHAELAVLDWQKNTTHLIKDANYSEQYGVFSPDNKWLAYIRKDAINCDIRVISTSTAIETWRLSADSKLSDCANNVLTYKLSWPKNNILLAQFGDQLKRFDVSFEPFPRASSAERSIASGIADMSVFDSQIVVLNKQGNKLTHLDFNGQIMTALSLGRENYKYVASNGKQTWLSREGLALYQRAQFKGDVRLAHGEATALSLHPNGNTLIVEKGLSKVGLFNLDTAQQTLSRASSLLSNSYLPVLSSDGRKYAYATKDQNGISIWLAYARQASVKRLIDLKQQKLPDVMLFSPNGKFLLIGDLNRSLQVIDLVTTSSITLAEGQFDNVYWHQGSDGVYYSQLGKNQQHWFFDLDLGRAKLNTSVTPIEYLIANKDKRAQIAQGFRQLNTFVANYLSERIFDPLVNDSLVTSLQLFTPSIDQVGIYFVSKRANRFILYRYEFDSEDYYQVTSLDDNSALKHSALTITSDRLGKSVILNQVVDFEGDLITLTMD